MERPTFDQLKQCSPTWNTQITLLFVQAAFWYTFIAVFTSVVVKPYVKSRPWCQQWTELNRKTFKASFFVDFKTDEEAFNFAALFISILIQHGVGGLMCVPSITGWLPASVAAPLARHGAMCELGWEVQDTFIRVCQILFGGAAGRAMNPTPLLVILAIHHCTAMGMVMPMNMYYGDSTLYHEMVFLLEGAAFVAMGLQNFGRAAPNEPQQRRAAPLQRAVSLRRYTLNVKSAWGLLQMKFAVTTVLLTMMWSRCLRFLYVGYLTFKAEHRRAQHTTPSHAKSDASWDAMPLARSRSLQHSTA